MVRVKSGLISAMALTVFQGDRCSRVNVWKGHLSYIPSLAAWRPKIVQSQAS